jgi:pimeloyl-ACP methyl ester carboxylesterase
LFRALILVDPVLFSPTRVLQLRIIRALGIGRRERRMVEAALRRRTEFDSLEQMFAGYRRRGVFRFFTDDELRALVQGLTRPREDGRYDLIYSPEWEARIYETGIWRDADLWSGIRKLRMPMLFLRGEETDTFFVETAEIAQRRNPLVRVQTIPKATHLVPLERPAEVAEAVRQFAGELSSDGA